MKTLELPRSQKRRLRRSMRGSHASSSNQFIPPEPTTVAQIEILSEQELPGRWRFEMQSLDDAGVLRSHIVTLSWADYNLWSKDGADEPSRVADAAISFMLSRMPAADLPDKFDASAARRRFPVEADRIIPTLIGR